MRLLHFYSFAGKGGLTNVAKAKNRGARLLNLVVNLFVLTVCLIIITSMIFVAGWMRVTADHTGPGYGKSNPSTPFLTSREAAKLLNLPTQTIRDMINRKELATFKVGYQWRIICRSKVTKLISHFF
jgi:excisionase family DNA binding protein